LNSIVHVKKFRNDSRWQLKEDSNAPKHVLFELWMQKLDGFQILLVDDSKPTWEA
jgi:hypothetical protein